MIDIHAHILPRLDDGPRAVKTALQMARIAVEEGIDTMIATPHCYNGVFNPQPQTIIDSCRSFNYLLEEASIPLKVLPGSEIHLVPEIIELAGSENLLTLNNSGKYILLELPERVVLPFVVSVIRKLKRLGMTPVIAHPERNATLQKMPEAIKEIVFAGALTQITSKSLTGFFKGPEKKTAVAFIEMDAVHFMASDAHSVNARPPKLKTAVKQLVKIAGPGRAEEIMVYNPERLVHGGKSNRRMKLVG